MWTPQYVPVLDNAREMFALGIESEKSAIRQYKAYMEMIKDEYVSAVPARIVKNEEYHMMVLEVV